MGKPRNSTSTAADAAQMTFFEFFAGGGMARAGLGPRWRCVFANDFDHRKSATYRENWGSSEIVTKDVGTVAASELPGTPDLVWASFPCQDLSLAGMGAGLKGNRSGTFWPFWRVVTALRNESRAPRVIVLENVCGTLTSHDGKDFRAISDALSEAGYNFGAVVIDAENFVPQSRPRLFVIGVLDSVTIPNALVSESPITKWHTKALKLAQSRMSKAAKGKWVWWNLPIPNRRALSIADIIQNEPTGVEWHTPEETAKLLGMMSDVNAAKVENARHSGETEVGTIYKRTRIDEAGIKVQRAEVRFDGIAGCLRTSSGGSSRQLILVVSGSEIRSRLLSSREAARLMGLPDSYVLPHNYNESYHLTGDGVVVPVVRFLAEHLLEPLVNAVATPTRMVA